MKTILVSSLLGKLNSYVCVKANELVLKCFSSVYVVWIEASSVRCAFFACDLRLRVS